MANYVKFLRGTPQAYANLAPNYNADTLYFISNEDEGEVQLYLGAKLISNGEISNFSIGDLKDVIVDNVENKQILVYDNGVSAWVNTNYKDLIDDFVGATETSDGISGLVPVPGKDKLNHFLRSDGQWVKIEVDNPEMINYSGEAPIIIDENGVISLATDNTTIGIIDNSLSIVGFKDAAENAILTKTANGLEWIVPEESRDDEFATAIESIISDINTINSNIDTINEKIESLENNIAEITKNTPIIQSNNEKIIVSTEDNIVTISHEKVGPENGFTSSNSNGAVESFGDSATIKIPALTVDEYGHINTVDEKEFTVSIPQLPTFVDTNTQYTLDYVDDIVNENNEQITKKYIQLKTTEGEVISRIDASEFIKDGMLEDVLYDEFSNTLTFLWNIDSGPKIETIQLTDLLDPYVAGDKIEINGTTISHAKIETSDLSAGEAGTRKYVTAIETDGYGHITGYKLEDETVVDTNTTYTLSGKTDGKTIVLTPSEGASTEVSLDVYTTEEVYTKSETDKKIENYVESVTGGESAGEVLGKLENYQATIDAEIWGSDVTKDWVATDKDGAEYYAPNYQTTSRIDIIKEKVDTIQSGAQINIIDNVDSSFTIGENKTLQLNNIEIAKVSNLQDQLDSKLTKNNINTDQFQYIDGKLSLLKDYEEGAQVNFIQAVDTLVFEVKVEKLGQDEDGADVFGNKLNLINVPAAALLNTLGDLSKLPNAGEMKMVDEINNIYESITWKDLEN